MKEVEAFINAMGTKVERTTTHSKHKVPVYWVQKYIGYYIFKDGLYEVLIDEEGDNYIAIEDRYEAFQIIVDDTMDREFKIAEGYFAYVMGELGKALAEHLITIAYSAIFEITDNEERNKS
jgi:hypothetical protein